MSSDLFSLITKIENACDPEYYEVADTEHLVRLAVAEYVNGQNSLVASARVVDHSAVQKVIDRHIAANIGTGDPQTWFANVAIEVVDFLELAYGGSAENNASSHMDLLPVGHPQSLRNYGLTASARAHAVADWVAADPRITSEVARKAVYNAYRATPNTVESDYAAEGLSSLIASGALPEDLSYGALVAAFNMSFAERSARSKALAAVRRRDRRKRFADEFGRLRGFFSNRDGTMFSAVAKIVGAIPGTNKYEVQYPDTPGFPAGIYEQDASTTENVKAVLSKRALKNVKSLAKPASDFNDFDQKSAIPVDEFVKTRKDTPNGWTKNEDGTFTSASGNTMRQVESLPKGEYMFEGLGENNEQDAGEPLFEIKDSNGDILGVAQDWSGVQKISLTYDELKSSGDGNEPPSDKAAQPSEEDGMSFEGTYGSVEVFKDKNGKWVVSGNLVGRKDGDRGVEVPFEESYDSKEDAMAAGDKFAKMAESGDTQDYIDGKSTPTKKTYADTIKATKVEAPAEEAPAKPLSAKQLEPASPKQYALLKELQEERADISENQNQAINDALEKQNLTKAQMAGLFGELQKKPFKPEIDSTKPSDRMLNSLTDYLANKELSSDEVNEALDQISAGISRADAEKLLAKLRRRPDRATEEGLGQAPVENMSAQDLANGFWFDKSADGKTWSGEGSDNLVEVTEINGKWFTKEFSGGNNETGFTRESEKQHGSVQEAFEYAAEVANHRWDQALFDDLKAGPSEEQGRAGLPDLSGFTSTKAWKEIEMPRDPEGRLVGGVMGGSFESPDGRVKVDIDFDADQEGENFTTWTSMSIELDGEWLDLSDKESFFSGNGEPLEVLEGIVTSAVARELAKKNITSESTPDDRVTYANGFFTRDGEDVWTRENSDGNIEGVQKGPNGKWFSTVYSYDGFDNSWNDVSEDGPFDNIQEAFDALGAGFDEDLATEWDEINSGEQALGQAPATKMAEDATDAQYSYISSMLNSKQVPEDLKSAVAKALEDRNLSKAQIGEIIGQMRDLPDNPDYDPNAPTQRMIESVKRNIVAKGLSQEDQDAILAELPNMDKATMSELIGRLKAMPDAGSEPEAAVEKENLPEAPVVRKTVRDLKPGDSVYKINSYEIGTVKENVSYKDGGSIQYTDGTSQRYSNRQMVSQIQVVDLDNIAPRGDLPEIVSYATPTRRNPLETATPRQLEYIKERLDSGTLPINLEQGAKQFLNSGSRLPQKSNTSQFVGLLKKHEAELKEQGLGQSPAPAGAPDLSNIDADESWTVDTYDDGNPFGTPEEMINTASYTSPDGRVKAEANYDTDGESQGLYLSVELDGKDLELTKDEYSLSTLADLGDIINAVESAIKRETSTPEQAPEQEADSFIDHASKKENWKKGEYTSPDGRLKVTLEGDPDGNYLDAKLDGKDLNIGDEDYLKSLIEDVYNYPNNRMTTAQLQQSLDEIAKMLNEDIRATESEQGLAQTPSPSSVAEAANLDEDGDEILNIFNADQLLEDEISMFFQTDSEVISDLLYRNGSYGDSRSGGVEARVTFNDETKEYEATIEYPDGSQKKETFGDDELSAATWAGVEAADANQGLLPASYRDVLAGGSYSDLEKLRNESESPEDFANKLDQLAEDLRNHRGDPSLAKSLSDYADRIREAKPEEGLGQELPKA